MAFNRIKRMRVLLKDMKEQADAVLTQCSDFLEPGVWKVSDNLTFLYKKGYRGGQKQENRFLWNGLPSYHSDIDGTERFARFLFTKSYRFKIRKMNFNEGKDVGQIIAYTSRKNSFKILNKKEQFLITLYHASESMQDYLTKRDLWAKAGDGCFPVPPILKIDFQRRYIKEVLLQKQHFLPEEAFGQILNDYQRFFASTGEKSVQGSISTEDTIKLMETAQKFGLSDLGARTLTFLQSEEYRLNLNHGDLNPPNLIYADGKYFYIDFETVGVRYFFYDILYYMAKSFRLYGSDLLQKYLEGVYDQSISELFRLNGAHYTPEDRRVYLLAFEMLFSGFGEFPLLLPQKALWQDTPSA